jgi:uncharacterized protein involved in exopolysaccharide biosynthesis
MSDTSNLATVPEATPKSNKLAERVSNLPEPDNFMAQNNFITTLLRRWPLVVLGMLLGILLGLGMYLTSPKIYESKAQILVIKREVGLLVESSRLSYVEDYVSTQQVMLKSRKIMQATANKLGPESVRLDKPLASDPNVRTDELIAGIGVNRERDAVSGTIGNNLSKQSFS